MEKNEVNIYSNQEFISLNYQQMAELLTQNNFRQGKFAPDIERDWNPHWWHNDGDIFNPDSKPQIMVQFIMDLETKSIISKYKVEVEYPYRSTVFKDKGSESVFTCFEDEFFRFLGNRLKNGFSLGKYHPDSYCRKCGSDTSRHLGHCITCYGIPF